MAQIGNTKDYVPRKDKEGRIGDSETRWAEIHGIAIHAEKFTGDLEGNAKTAKNSEKVGGKTVEEIITTGTSGKQIYTTPGTYTWTVPINVTQVWVDMSGGGGAGSAKNGATGTAGGTSSFGNMLSCPGGGGGESGRGGASGGIGGTDGGAALYSGTGVSISGDGGNSLFGSGGPGGGRSNAKGVMGGGYGTGGGGGGNGSFDGGGGGGGAAAIHAVSITVTPGANITITVGAGGIGSGNGGSGADGFCLIEW